MRKTKILASISESSREGILDAAREFLQHPVDICEWRIDCYERPFDADSVVQLTGELTEVLEGIPLLATVRSAGEGGQWDCSIEEYENTLAAVCESGQADYIDLEAFFEPAAVDRLVGLAYENDLVVLMSSHDFDKTPDSDELEARLLKMMELGADVAKLAVMPQCEEDVARLLEITERVTENHPEVPVMTISMGKLGEVSRTDGWRYGSWGTFGCIGRASAPGQIEVDELAAHLK